MAIATGPSRGQYAADRDDALRAAGGLDRAEVRHATGGRRYSRMRASGPDGLTMIEQWTIHGRVMPGPRPAERRYTDAAGPMPRVK